VQGSRGVEVQRKLGEQGKMGKMREIADKISIPCSLFPV